MNAKQVARCPHLSERISAKERLAEAVSLNGCLAADYFHLNCNFLKELSDKFVDNLFLRRFVFE